MSGSRAGSHSSDTPWAGLDLAILMLSVGKYAL